jgi:hypothetical protein
VTTVVRENNFEKKILCFTEKIRKEPIIGSYCGNINIKKKKKREREKERRKHHQVAVVGLEI